MIAPAAFSSISCIQRFGEGVSANRVGARRLEDDF